MKLTIESEHGLDYFIELTAHYKKASVRLHKDDPSYWRMSSYGEPKLDKWIATSKCDYPEALRRTLIELELYCCNEAVQERKARDEEAAAVLARAERAK